MPLTFSRNKSELRASRVLGQDTSRSAYLNPGQPRGGGGGGGGGVEILLVASCYGNRGKLRPDILLGSYTDLTFYLTLYTQQHFCFCGEFRSERCKGFDLMYPNEVFQTTE